MTRLGGYKSTGVLSRILECQESVTTPLGRGVEVRGRGNLSRSPTSDAAAWVTRAREIANEATI